ncbi:MAG: hypothetical protein EYC62_08915 [Alphaproteobacteria bacterium]|nr:MAG: hypothetical protein EYC62_08915 [Alphaproteobacteria bacterium]
MASRQISFEWPHSVSMRRNNFAVNPSNQTALQWIESWPHWGSYASVIYGPKGSGKTHLAHIWAEKSQGVFLDSKLAEADFMAVAQKFKCLVIDDADQFTNQQLLFHTLNSAKNNNGSLLLLARSATPQWKVTLPDLSSRLNALPQIAIATPDQEMLAILMTKQFADRQMAVDPGVIDYAVVRLNRSYAAIQAFVDMADQFSLEMKRRVTVSLARDIVQELDRHFAVPDVPDKA